MSSWLIRDESPYHFFLDSFDLDRTMELIKERYKNIKGALTAIGEALAPVFEKMPMTEDRFAPLGKMHLHENWGTLPLRGTGERIHVTSA